MRVLVLEDSETSRFVIRAVLERAGLVCLEAENAAQASRLLREQPPDLLIADAILRNEDGVKVAQRLRQACPGLPVLFVSGYPLQHLQANGLDEGHAFPAGSFAFLQKPFTSDALLSSIQTLLHSDRQREATGT